MSPVILEIAFTKIFEDKKASKDILSLDKDFSKKQSFLTKLKVYILYFQNLKFY